MFKIKDIIADLGKNFDILEILKIKWSKNKFIENLSRFYGGHFRVKTMDVDGRGNDSFVVVTFLDNNPSYGIEMTSSGHALVNLNILTLKNKYRDWVGNEYAIHSTVTTKETKHDLVLLLGKNYEDYLIEFTNHKKQKGLTITLMTDLMGANGWKSVEDVFYVLNECASYTILRDFEASPLNLRQTSDIDILVDDVALERVPIILNATSDIDDTPGTFMCNVIVENMSIPFHLHSFAYLSSKWVMDILNTRIFNKYKLYVPSLENQFYSLYYQLIHWKLILKEKYTKFLEDLYKVLFNNTDVVRNNFDNYIVLLNNFMFSKGYLPYVLSYVRQNPIEILEVIRKNIECFNISNIVPFRVDLWKSDKGSKFFIGLTKDGKKVLIKYFGVSGILKKEYQILNFLSKHSSVKVPTPLFYASMRAGNQLLITEYIDAQHISKKMVDGLDEKHKKKVLEQIVKAISFFYDNKLIHRDLDPSNILVDKDSNVYIVDYEYMIDVGGVILSQRLYNNDYSLMSLYNLGFPNNLGILKWNDAYSAIKIIQSFDLDFENKYPELYNTLNNIKKDSRSTYSLNKITMSFIKKKIKYELSMLIKRCSKFSMKIVKKINT
jgi:hypothetical protein